jgi:hypothetical protein
MKHFVVLFLFLGSCVNMSENVVLNEVYNLKRSKKAILFLKYTGATDDNSLQVTVANDNYEFTKKENGNAFIVNSDHNSTTQDNKSIRLIWVSDDTLLVEYDKELRTFVKNTNVQNVIIVYKER